MSGVGQSRQQRRAAEREARKRPTLPERFYDVELHRYIDETVPEDDSDRGPWWGAECGLRDDSTGVEIDSGLSLQDVVDEAVEEAGRWTDRFRIRIQWSLAPGSGGKDAATVAAEHGVELPELI